MAPVIGFAFLGLSVTPVGKRVFLLVVANTPNAMLCMTTTAGMVQKAAFGRSKSPPLAVKKQQLVLSHLYDATDRNKVIIFFTGAAGLFFYRQRRTFCICGFSACHQAGADGGGGEYPRACSRDISRHTRTHRA